MTAWNPRANELFLKALEIHSPSERQDYLDGTCAGDPALRAEVESLLDASFRAGSFLEELPAANLDMPAAHHTAEGPGAVIGPYKLVELIADGGMGTVWMAQQSEPVKRLVALKVIRPGMDSKQVLARFDAERQALALMDHPNIAKVFDAGAAPDGRPFFVMELVKGVPITKFCDQHRLTPRQRLELFVPICHAIQHAHQKGIIHRDVKPSNVLVALYDDKPVPKVIDFGVAKATGQLLTEQTLHTSFGAVVGTVEYMSPEQATFNQLDVDTRSDIYSLGVLLYELLAGSPPFTKKELEKAGMLEMLRVIREKEPSKPSTKLSTADGLPTLAANRGTEPAKLTRLVRGELDWIVMKALEKDRSRRYESANGFAGDVQRYLAGEAVQAVPPSAGYRLRKFARRNKGPVLAAALVVLTLVAGVVGTSIGLVQAADRAAGERRAKDTAEKRLAQIEKGIDLLGSLFADLDPFAEEKEGRPLRAILRDRLDQTAAALEGEAIGDPLVVARLQDRLGQTYLGLGSPARAEALFAKAIATRQAELGADHPLTLDSRHNQARAYEAAGKRIEAIKRFVQVRDARMRVLGPDSLDTLSTLDELGVAYLRSGRSTEAIALLEPVRDARVKQLGENHDHTLATLGHLAAAYLAAQKYPEAIALAEKVRDARVKKHGDIHPRAIEAVANLAYAYQAGYRMKEALDLYTRAQGITLLKLGLHHPVTLKVQSGLAHMYRVYRRTPEAIGLLEKVRERQVTILGGHHPATLMTLLELAMTYQDAGELDKALPLFQQAATGVEKLEYAHSEAGRMVSNLARCHEQLKQYEQAEVWRRKWLPMALEIDGPESFRYASFIGLAGLGSNLVQQKKYAEAEPVVRESLAILQKNFPGWESFRAQSLLGAVLVSQEKYAEAEPHLVQACQGMKKLVTGSGHTSHGSLDRQNLIEALERLVQLYDATNSPDEVAKWRKELEANRAAEKTMKPKGKRMPGLR